MSEERLVREWARVGIASGLAVTAVYTSFFVLPDRTPTWLVATVVSLFGPLLTAGSVALYQVMVFHRRTVTVQLAVIANIVAGALVTGMLLVQTAVGTQATAVKQNAPALWPALRHVDLGLDVAWDIYIGLGTVLFAANAYRHPVYGRVLGATGILVGAALLILNCATFPTPPGNAGLIDVGPFVGLWYTAMSLMALRVPRWLAQRSS